MFFSTKLDDNISFSLYFTFGENTHKNLGHKNLFVRSWFGPYQTIFTDLWSRNHTSAKKYRTHKIILYGLKMFKFSQEQINRLTCIITRFRYLKTQIKLLNIKQTHLKLIQNVDLGKIET